MAKKSKSPRSKAGVIDSERTTTIGDSAFKKTDEPFQAARAEATTFWLKVGGKPSWNLRLERQIAVVSESLETTAFFCDENVHWPTLGRTISNHYILTRWLHQRIGWSWRIRPVDLVLESPVVIMGLMAVLTITSFPLKVLLPMPYIESSHCYNGK